MPNASKAFLIAPPAASGLNAYVGVKLHRATIGPLATVTVIPAPPPGFIRFLAGDTAGSGGASGALGIQLGLVGNPVANALYEMRLLGAPFGSIVVRDNAAVNGQYNQETITRSPALFDGESYEIANQDAVQTIEMVALTLDLPDTGYTKVRVQTNGLTPVVLIPAAPAGKIRVLSDAAWLPGMALQPAYLYSNMDNIAHGWVVKNGTTSLVYYPGGALSANNIFYGPGVPGCVVDSTGALTHALDQATNSVEGWVVSAYKELDSP